MKKLLGLLVVLAAAFVVTVPAHAAIGQLTQAKMKLGTSIKSTSTSHTFTFVTAQTASLKRIRFQYCKAPSGGCVVPDGLSSGSATDPGAGTRVGLTGGSWALSSANGDNYFQNAAGESINNGTTITLSMGGITNNNIGDCHVGAQSSDTCYVIITTYTDTANAAPVDTTIVSYTVTEAVQVTARVDPTFTFVVSAVDAGSTNNGITTSVASTYSTLPFGNLTAGTPKYAAHKLNVTTNTQGGYTVTAAMTTPMTGVYGANNFDPFSAPWDTATDWTHPTGTSASVDTGWFGANTTDSAFNTGSGPNGATKFGGVGGTPVVVKDLGSSDNGATNTYVTYAIEANVFQPADTYTGTLVYNALPTY